MDPTQSLKTWRTLAWVGGSISAVVLVSMANLLVSSLVSETWEKTAAEPFIFLALMLLGAISAVSLLWRRSHPVVALGIDVGLSILFPLASLGALVALPWVISKEPKRTAAISTVAAGAATGVVLFKDFHRPAQFAVFSGVAQPPTQLVWWGYVLVWVGLMFVSVSSGLVRLFRSSASQQAAVAAAQVLEADSLRGELSRKEERELIAREMHDTVAHQLSLISMQAGVLEVTTSDPLVPDSARLMRASVHKALEEMRVLISSLRDSDTEQYTGAAPSFQALTGMLEQAQEAGAQVQVDLQISRVAQPAQRLAAAVYRIVQESVTNAIKYGAQAPIMVRVWAGPSLGVYIDVINEIERGPAHHQEGARAGLPGMVERASMLDGTLQYYSTGSHWRVTAQLPWSSQ